VPGPEPTPAGAIPAIEVRAALGRVTRSAPFLHSPQLQRFLSFLVDQTLDGRAPLIKEYVIALEVFSRPGTFDPRMDSLVRVEARRLREALRAYYEGDGRLDPIVIEIPKGGYVPAFRRAAQAEASVGSANRPAAPLRAGVPGEPAAAQDLASPDGGSRPGGRSRWRIATITVVVAAVATGLILTFGVMRSRRVEALTERDSIVIAGFTNATGEAIFDETLKQGLATGLEQSPFLNIVPDRRVGRVLTLMGRPQEARLDPDLARELCLRAEGKAFISGSLSRVGSQYVIGLTATSCGTGEDFAHVQTEADRRESVLNALGKATSIMRGRLGESLNSIQKFQMPIEEATTSSLEALQAYSLGKRTAREKGSPADIPYYERAIALDRDFAAALAALGVSYINLGQPGVAGEYLERAFQLSGRVSERERFRISAYYHQAVTGDLERANQSYELWTQSYPREFAAHINLGLGHLWLGDYDRALSQTRRALEIEPGNVLAYTNLAAICLKLGRPEEAQRALDEARSRGLTSKFLRSNLCYLAFLRGDMAAPAQQLAQAGGPPGEQDALLSLQADTEAYLGRLDKARELSRRAADAAIQAGAKEAGAFWLVNAALREAEFGNAVAAGAAVDEAMRLAPGRDAEAVAALARARAGDVAGARALLADLESRHPRNTVIHLYWAPAVRAAIELRGGMPSRAVELLQGVQPYDLASPPPIGLATLYPVYVRGEANLRAGQAAAAAVEFQRILDHPGLVLNFPLHALSHLQLARARALAGDRAESRRLYERLFELWKDADPGLGLLKAARAECRALE
jgi:tetratricopeptide (TPR) repeat protein